MKFRLLHADDRTPCPGIYECERCAIEWFLHADIKYLKLPVTEEARTVNAIPAPGGREAS